MTVTLYSPTHFYRYIGETALDLPGVVKLSTPFTPILLMYSSEGNLAEKLFHEYANKKQSQTVVIPLSNAGANEERRARRTINTAMQEVRPKQINYEKTYVEKTSV